LWEKRRPPGGALCSTAEAPGMYPHGFVKGPWHLPLGQGFVAGVDPAQRVRQRAGGVGDDVGVASVGLRGTGVQVGDAAHGQPGQVGHLVPAGAGNSDRNAPIDAGWSTTTSSVPWRASLVNRARSRASVWAAARHAAACRPAPDPRRGVHPCPRPIRGTPDTRRAPCLRTIRAVSVTGWASDCRRLLRQPHVLRHAGPGRARLAHHHRRIRGSRLFKPTG